MGEILLMVFSFLFCDPQFLLNGRPAWMGDYLYSTLTARHCNSYSYFAIIVNYWVNKLTHSHKHMYTKTKLQNRFLRCLTHRIALPGCKLDSLLPLI